MLKNPLNTESVVNDDSISLAETSLCDRYIYALHLLSIVAHVI